MSIITFPRRPIRAWRVFPAKAPASGYHARRFGEGPYVGPDRTDVGSLDLVVEALVRPEIRRGLPVVAPPECLPDLMSKPSPLRIFPWKRQIKTERQKYEDALQDQRERDGREASRWVPCDEDRGDPS